MSLKKSAATQNFLYLLLGEFKILILVDIHQNSAVGHLIVLAVLFKKN